ncbi:LysR substrate-binding domain-containing protein [Achromobacter xylosoxidans]
MHEGRSAHLQVGAVPYVSATLLSAAASGLYRRHGATLTLHRATTDQLVPMLRGHELDCVISRATSTLVADDLTHHVLYRQRACLVAHVASARRLARRKSDWAAVAGMDWVLPAAGTPTRRLIAEHFIHAGLRAPAPVLEAYSTDVIEGMLAVDEALVSVLPDDIAAEVCQHGKLGRVPWDFGWELPPINLIRRREARALVAEEAFAAILLECCAGQKRQGPGPGLSVGSPWSR